MDPELGASGSPPRLCDFIRDGSEEILAAWEEAVRGEPVAHGLSTPELRDHMPELLRHIAAVVESVHTGRKRSMEGLPELHALARLDLGVDLGALVNEYKLLRGCVLRLYGQRASGVARVVELQRFDDCLDDAIRASVARYATARGRTLLALDRLSEAALGSTDLSDFFRRLLEVVVETVDAVDMGAIFLWERDALRVRASVGMLEGFDALVLALGEGFAGHVAAERRAVELRDAGSSPMIRTRALPRETKALYGVPFVEDERVLGVAYMGSRTAYEFSPEDTILLRAMASRATAFVVQARLRHAEAAERRRADLQNRLLESTLRSLPVGVVVAEAPSGRFMRSNAAFDAIWRRPAVHLGTIEEYAARYPSLFPDGRRVTSEDTPLARALLRGEAAHEEELVIERGDGTRAVTLQSAAPVRGEGDEVVAGVLSVVDITELKRAEERLRETAAFRERFIGVLSHDLKNLLGIITNTATVLLARETQDEGAAGMASRIARTSERMARMIRDLLDFTRGRLGGGMPVAPAPGDLGAICGQVVDEFRAAHPDREVRLDAGGDLRGEWDADRVAQALMNLVKNAHDYGTPGTPVDVAAIAGGTWVEVVVTNRGPPIPADQLEHVFEPYRRASDQRARSGLGLGLFIVREVARAHGGTVAPRVGDDEVAFVLRLPRSPPARPPAA